MPVFEYKGLTQTGKAIKGAIDADSARAARAKLKRDGIFVTDLKDKKKAPGSQNRKKGGLGGKSVDVKSLALMTRQLATLIKSNIPLVDALTAVSEQVEHPVLQEALFDSRNMVNEGAPFYKSLAKYPNIFDSTYISMCEAGEMSGTLDAILLRLAEFTEAQNELNSKIRGALTYPLIMLVVTFGMIIFLFTYVVPKIVVVFESFPDLKLPWYTEMLLSLSNIMINYWYILLIAALVLVATFNGWKRTPGGQIQWDRFLLRAPIFGEMNRFVAVSRFTRTLAILLNGGVPMLTALQIVRNVVNNRILAAAIDEARSNISEGETIAGPLKKSEQFPPIVIHMVNIGEKTGELETMLLQVADAFDFQVKSKIETLTSAMGPIVLVLMGLAIGIIMFAVMVPMFELLGAVG